MLIIFTLAQVFGLVITDQQLTPKMALDNLILKGKVSKRCQEEGDSYQEVLKKISRNKERVKRIITAIKVFNADSEAKLVDLEPVTDPRFGDDVVRASRINFYLASQIADINM
jgi:hypothetical protein